MSNRLTHEEIIIYLRNKKMKPAFTKEWFNENYKNASTYLPLFCECGKVMEKSMNSIRQKKVFKELCNECMTVAKQKYCRKTYKEVVAWIKKNKCKPAFTKEWFNDNYKGVFTYLPIICKCNKPINQKYTLLKKSPGCDDCRKEKRRRKSIPFEDAIKRVKEKNLKPDFNKSWYNQNYQGQSTILPVICKCKQPIGITFSQLRENICCWCKDCMNEEKIIKKYNELIKYLEMKKVKPIFTYDWFKTNYSSNMSLPLTCQECKEKLLAKFSCLYKHSLKCRSCKIKAGKRKKKKYTSIEEILKTELEGKHLEDVYL